ncbi:MAG: dihydroneopterin aldolase [Planctomycetota bacterium]
MAVEDLHLRVRLGCTESERATPQGVALGLSIRFAEPPLACRSDRLADTVCYAALAEAAKKCCAGREFQTVERLAHDLYEQLAALLPPGAALRLRVTKLRPPVRGLRGGVSFTIGEP